VEDLGVRVAQAVPARWGQSVQDAGELSGAGVVDALQQPEVAAGVV
jgi:hypothetical protein